MNEPKRLFRSSDDRIIGGVAGGLGRYFDVDPLLFRIGFAVTVFLGGLGLLAYIAGWLFVPREDGRRIASPRLLVYLLLAALALAAGLCLAFLSAWAGVEGLGEIVAGLVVLIGIGLVIASFTGITWARWLAVPALLMAAPVGAVAAADLEFEGGYGERYHRPTSVAAIPDDGYELAAGELQIDLRGLDWRPGQVVEVELDLGAGEALVVVPEDVCVETDAHVTAGEIDLRGDSTGGLDVDSDERHPGSSAPRLRLESDITFGELRVEDDVFGDGDDGHRDFGGRSDDDDAAEADAARRACEAT